MHVNVLPEKTALHVGINIVYGLKGLNYLSISSQNVENVILLKKAGKHLESFFYEPLHFRKNETYEEEAGTIRIQSDSEK